MLLRRFTLFLGLKVEPCVPIGQFAYHKKHFLKCSLQEAEKKASTEATVITIAIARILAMAPVTYPAPAEMPWLRPAPAARKAAATEMLLGLRRGA
jgi:hypothetical protein